MVKSTLYWLAAVAPPHKKPSGNLLVCFVIYFCSYLLNFRFSIPFFNQLCLSSGCCLPLKTTYLRLNNYYLRVDVFYLQLLNFKKTNLSKLRLVRKSLSRHQHSGWCLSLFVHSVSKDIGLIGRCLLVQLIFPEGCRSRIDHVFAVGFSHLVQE